MFSDFVRSPAATLRHLRDLISNRAQRYVGHNPAGGAMIVALLFCLSGTVFPGLVLYAIEEDAGPLAIWVAEAKTWPPLLAIISTAGADEYEDDGDEREEHEDDAGEEFWEELHEVFANLMLLLIVLHVAGVLYSSYVEKENLVKAMFTGRKRSF